MADNIEETEVLETYSTESPAPAETATPRASLWSAVEQSVAGRKRSHGFV
jgi:hypothetical protein